MTKPTDPSARYAEDSLGYGTSGDGPYVRDRSKKTRGEQRTADKHKRVKRQTRDQYRKK